jgi:hypothetical protein
MRWLSKPFSRTLGTLGIAAILVVPVAAGVTPAAAAAAWQIVPSPNSTANDALGAVAVVSPSSVWAAGTAYGTSSNSTGLIEHYNGSAWSISATPALSGARYTYLTGLAADSASDAWAVGFELTSRSHTSPVAAHYNGTSWSIAALPQQLQLSGLSAVAAVSASNVWAVGDDSSTTATGPPLIEHYDGTTWSVTSTSVTTAGSLNSVAAVSASNVWAVGSQPGTGLAMHYDGTGWTQASLPAPTGGQWELTGVSASSASDLWAVGYVDSADGLAAHGIAEHFNGSTWSVTQLPDLGSSYPFNTLSAVDDVAPGNVWAIGTSVTSNGQSAPLVEHFDGTSWQVAAAPSSGSLVLSLAALASTSTGQLWAVGGSHAAGSTADQTLTARYG